MTLANKRLYLKKNYRFSGTFALAPRCDSWAVIVGGTRIAFITGGSSDGRDVGHGGKSSDGGNIGCRGRGVYPPDCGNDDPGFWSRYAFGKRCSRGAFVPAIRSTHRRALHRHISEGFGPRRVRARTPSHRASAEIAGALHDGKFCYRQNESFVRWRHEMPLQAVHARSIARLC
jgi:hypothetical protein